MKKLFKVMVLLGMLLMSSVAMAEKWEVRMNKFERELRREYPVVEVLGKRYRLDFELKKLDSVILLDADIEDSYFTRKGIRFEKELSEILSKAANDVRREFKEPVRVVVDHNGKNFFRRTY